MGKIELQGVLVPQIQFQQKDLGLRKACLYVEKEQKTQLNKKGTTQNYCCYYVITVAVCKTSGQPITETCSKSYMSISTASQ